jgi:hypothetical protein
MATPHVSAVAALVWSLHTNCSAEQLSASLNKSALDLGAPGRDEHFGFGLVQAKAAHDRISALGCGIRQRLPERLRRRGTGRRDAWRMPGHRRADQASRHG